MPPESVSASASVSAPPACRKAYVALLGKAIDAETRAHLDGCPECALLEGLLMGSRVSGGGSERTPMGRFAGAPLDPELERMLGGLVGSGELLLGKYRVEERVAGGGQGVVFRAVDTDNGQTVAIKAVHCDPGDPSSGIEDLHGRNVHHTNIVAVYTAERHGGLRLIVMEFVSDTLASAKERLSDDEKLAVFRKVCDGVAAAHEADILHLDLKPGNILVRPSKEPAVTDFGLSVKAKGGEAARAPGYTDRYAAPEQLHDRPVNRRTDVYALGRILETLLPSAPRAIRRAIRRATANDPGARFPDARTLAAAVDLAAIRRRRLVRAVSGGAVAVLLLAALYFVVPPPAGRRVAWRSDLWGPDLVPRLARNVGVNVGIAPLPSMMPDSPSFPCARNVAELHDGVAHYRDMCHGYVFYGPSPICVPDEWFRDYPPAPADAARCPDGSGRILIPANDCDVPEGDGVVITLARPERIVALRAWFHQGVPTRLSVQVDDGAGGWKTVEAPKQVPEAFWENKIPPYFAGGAMSATILVTPPGVVTRRLRVATWCDAQGPSGTNGQPVWLNEIEVFAEMGRAEAWWSWLSGD